MFYIRSTYDAKSSELIADHKLSRLSRSSITTAVKILNIHGRQHMIIVVEHLLEFICIYNLAVDIFH